MACRLNCRKSKRVKITWSVCMKTGKHLWYPNHLPPEPTQTAGTSSPPKIKGFPTLQSLPEMLLSSPAKQNPTIASIHLSSSSSCQENPFTYKSRSAESFPPVWSRSPTRRKATLKFTFLLLVPLQMRRLATRSVLNRRLWLLSIMRRQSDLKKNTCTWVSSVEQELFALSMSNTAN